MAKVAVGDMGERLFRCKVCGYTAKSGAGLTGHIQLAHGERASGTKELAKLGSELSDFHQDVKAMAARLDDVVARDIAVRLSEIKATLSQPQIVPQLSPEDRGVLQAFARELARLNANMEELKGTQQMAETPIVIPPIRFDGFVTDPKPQHLAARPIVIPQPSIQPTMARRALPPVPPKEPTVGEVVATVIVGGLAIAGAIALIDALFGGNQGKS